MRLFLASTLGVLGYFLTLPFTTRKAQASPKKTVMLEPDQTRKVSELDKRLQPLAIEHIRLAREAQIDARITSGYRSFQRQAELYAQGRTEPGNIVTNAQPGESRHNYGEAYDLAIFVDDKPDWNRPESEWEKLGELGKSLGLEWGGDWVSLKDRPHFQLPKRKANL